jgi:hypothetical protein
MFRQIRFQTGEAKEIINELDKGNIPCIDVDDWEDFHRFVEILSRHGIIRAIDVPFDKNARDRVEEPEFEFRAAFTHKGSDIHVQHDAKLMFIDFYFEPVIDETYDTIFGD